MRLTSMALPVAAFIGGIAVPPATRADEYRGTMEQQMACTPDVWRLCSDQIPDVNRIVACLRQNTPQLSSGCRAVFESSDAGPPRARQNGRIVRARPNGAPPPQPYVGQVEPEPGPYYEQQRPYYEEEY